MSLTRDSERIPRGLLREGFILSSIARKYLKTTQVSIKIEKIFINIL